MFSLPRVTSTELEGTYEYTNYDDEKVKFTVKGHYDISTIPMSRGFQTVLFRREGAVGPNQIELWYYDGHPTPEKVNELLRNGEFYKW